MRRQADREEERKYELLCEVAKYLMPIAVGYDASGLSPYGRAISLDRKDWREHYDAGINRCIGFDILWK